MTKSSWMAAAFLAVTAVTAPLFAHHSFAAEYDDKKPVKLKGTIASVEWLNPHVWIYIDAKDEAGVTARWQCEGGAPNTLTRQGWSKLTLKPGDAVTVEGFMAKDATHTCNSRSVTLSDGRRVFAGSNEDGGPDANKKK